MIHTEKKSNIKLPILFLYIIIFLQFSVSKNFWIIILNILFRFISSASIVYMCAHPRYRNLMFEICPSDDHSERVPS